MNVGWQPEGLLCTKKGSPPVSSQMMTFAAFSFTMAGTVATVNSLSLVLPLVLPSPPYFLLVSEPFLFNLSGCIELSPSLSHSLSVSFLLSHPLALSSLTLSSTFLWITNDNGLCSLMWEFCNQPRCVAYALMALIFSDLNAPQDHQQQGERAHT